MEIWEAIAAERLALADLADQLDAAAWATPSLCDAWSVREVFGHLVSPVVVGLRGFTVGLVRARGHPHAANRALAAAQAARPTAELVADLRAGANSHVAPPGMGPIAPLTDLLIHSEDMRIPLGMPADRPAEVWRRVLDFEAGPKARRGFVPGRIPPVRLVTADLDWSHGEGPVVEGPAGAVAMTLAGRTARLGALAGPGRGELEAWLGA